MLPDDDPDFRFPFPFVVVVVTPEEPEEVEFGFLLFVDMVSVLSIVAVFISEPEAAAAATSTVVLEGSLGEELFDAITDDAEVGLEIEILIGTAVDWVPPEVVDDFEFAPESGVLKRSSAAVLLEVVLPGTLPLSLSVVTRNTVSLS